jgi:hypothetical protein
MRSQMKLLPRKSSLPVALSIALFVGASVSQAQIITFDTAASYDNNFAELKNGSFVSWVSGGYLSLTWVGAGVPAAAIYNSAASGGTGGSGGTTINTPYNTFGGSTPFTIQADYYQSNPQGGPAGTSFGFYVKASASSTPTSGYAAIFRLTDTGADFRVFDSNGNPSDSGVGTLLGTQTFSGGFSADTYYTLKLEVADIGSTVQFTGSIWNQGGSMITAFTSIVDSSSPVLGAGQVGFRWSNDGGSNTRIDNFGVVPEPSTVGFLAAGLTFGLFRRRVAWRKS